MRKLSAVMFLGVVAILILSPQSSEAKGGILKRMGISIRYDADPARIARRRGAGIEIRAGGKKIFEQRIFDLNQMRREQERKKREARRAARREELEARREERAQQRATRYGAPNGFSF